MRGEKVLTYLAELESNQRLSRNQINQIQQLKLQKLLHYVLKHNDYFIEKYKGYDPFNDFSSLPILSKEELRSNYKQLVTPNADKRMDLAKTSGSTGVPIKFYRDRVLFGYTLASIYRAHRWYGIDIGSKECMLWGVPIGLKNRFIVKTKDFLLNRFREKEFNLNTNTLIHIYDKILRERPDYLFGYTSMIYEFALFIQDTARDGKALKLKIVICTAEMIYDHQRAMIEEVLGCKVVSEYGAAETGIISYECPKGEHHISDDCVYIEIVDDDFRPLPIGETGKVIVTVLHSFSSPIIRYEIGDYASLSGEDCTCGIHLSLLKNIIGRTSDIIFTPNGKSYHSIILYYILKEYTDKWGGVNQFKVYQKKIDQLELHIVKGNEYDKNGELWLKKKIQEKFSTDMQVIFVYPDKIEREPSGKLRDFVSNLNTEKLLIDTFSGKLKSGISRSYNND